MTVCTAPALQLPLAVTQLELAFSDAVAFELSCSVSNPSPILPLNNPNKLTSLLSQTLIESTLWSTIASLYRVNTSLFTVP